MRIIGTSEAIHYVGRGSASTLTHTICLRLLKQGFCMRWLCKIKPFSHTQITMLIYCMQHWFAVQYLQSVCNSLWIKSNLMVCRWTFLCIRILPMAFLFTAHSYISGMWTWTENVCTAKTMLLWHSMVWGLVSLSLLCVLSKLLYTYLTETVSVGFLVKCRKSLLESLSLRYTLDLSRYSQ